MKEEKKKDERPPSPSKPGEASFSDEQPSKKKGSSRPPILGKETSLPAQLNIQAKV
jgi:hypothetical protein